MKYFFTTLFSILVLYSTTAQTNFTLRQSLSWTEKSVQANTVATNLQNTPHFKGANYSYSKTPSLPVFNHRFPLNSDGRLFVSINAQNFTPLSIKSNSDLSTLTENIEIKTFVSQERDKYFGNISFVPLRKKGENIEKLNDFDIKIVFQPNENRAVLRGITATKESVLKSGDIYKVSVKETGVVKIDLDFLKNQLKIPNIDQIDPRTIKIYGNGGGMLPEANAVNRPDDLTENAIFISGEDDGKFDASDFILFYAVGPDKTVFNKTTKTFDRPKNIYSNEAFYFIKISQGNGIRVAPQTSVPNVSFTSTSFNDFARFEEDKINILASQRCQCTQGSGKLWFGDAFTSSLNERTYSVNFPNIIASEPATINVQFACRAFQTTSFNTIVAGKTFAQEMSGSDTDGTEGTVANMQMLTEKFTPQSDNIEVKIAYPNANIAEAGWLDFIQISTRRRLQLAGSQMSFRDVKSLDVPATQYQISNINSNTLIWDITNPQSPKNQQVTLSGNQANFGANTEGVLKEFVAFDKNGITLKPNAVGKVSNQNIHAFDNLDLLIVYHKDFETAARTLLDMRKKQGLAAEMAEISQVYNEFSSGALDPSAIRDFARVLHKRNTRFKYLLLMGDGSFDYKRTYPLGNLQPSDFIPPYETDHSFRSIDAFPSDDYYGLLSDTEGVNLEGDLDIAVGRIVCKTAAEANSVVNKIKNYESSKSFGDWRNRALFMADDEDGNTHLDSANDIADLVYNTDKNLNIEKLYIDAFRQEVSAGGTRVPAMNEAIYQNQFKGLLTMCYLGHGGPKRLAQEAIITKEDMATWRNFDKMPIFITATCSFCGYDNPKEESAGELASLNSGGSMVALLSTVRPVYAQSNADLTRAVFENIFKKVNNRPQTIGEIITKAKNSSRTGDNGNKFTLIGDPSMRINLPHYDIVTTKINGKKTDTVRALQRVTIEGTIIGDNGQVLNTFNGTIFPTIYDKATTLRTLGQDQGSIVRDFSVQRNILFKGAASVKNGTWQFSFTLPKDIDYSFGNGKISYYATNGEIDAAGHSEDIVIGGTDPSVIADNKPPVVQVFMNDENFVSGGTTDPNPTLLVKLSDDTGINVTGISIGHDLAGTLDNSKNTIPLNDFYEAVKDDPTKGIVRYPLSKLALGQHKISVKAWDIANNSGEGATEFVVNSDAKTALAHVLNYPNPFSSNTKFQFDHSLVGQQLRVHVEIYAVNGQLIKTIDEDVFSDGNRVSNLEWDGKSDSGATIAKGIYLYKIRLTGNDLTGKKVTAESSLEKLVIIK